MSPYDEKIPLMIKDMVEQYMNVFGFNKPVVTVLPDSYPYIYEIDVYLPFKDTRVSYRITEQELRVLPRIIKRFYLQTFDHITLKV